MSAPYIQTLKIKAKLLQKAKLKAGNPIRLKQAFATLARVAGFPSWQALRATLDENGRFCPHGHSAYSKVWYASYSDACAHLATHGGFLLPFQRDFFICDIAYLEFLGIDAGDADLAKTGNNWVAPHDRQAFTNLLKKLRHTK